MFPLKSVLLAALALPVASAAFAQSASPSQPEAPRWAQHGDPVAMHKQHCTDHYAARAGHLATIEAKLNLTDVQRPAFAQWRQAEMDGAAKLRDACLAETPKTGVLPTRLERQARMEKMLSLKLDEIRASRPALQALYQTLSPEQQAVLNNAGRHHGHRHWHRGGN